LPVWYKDKTKQDGNRDGDLSSSRTDTQGLRQFKTDISE